MNKYLGVRTDIYLLEFLLCASDFLQTGQCKSDMFADTQIIDIEIGAGATIVTRLVAANGNLVSLLGLGIRQVKFRKDRMIVPVFQKKFLLLTVLYPEQTLPLFKAEMIRLVYPGNFGANAFICRFYR